MIIPSREWADAYCGSRTTLYHRIAGIAAPVIYVGVFLFLVARWRLLPERIPTHYDFAGEIDGWGSRWTLVIMPLIGFAVDITMAVTARFPQTWNAGVKITVFNRVRVYRLMRDFMADMRLACAVMFAYLSVRLALLPETLQAKELLLVILGLVFVPMLRYFIRVFRVR